MYTTINIRDFVNNGTRRFRAGRKKFLPFDREEMIYTDKRTYVLCYNIIMYRSAYIYCIIGLCSGGSGAYFSRGLLCFIIIRST